MLAPILHYLGAIEEDKVIEVQRTDLVGGYVGHTGIKTRSQVSKNLETHSRSEESCYGPFDGTKHFFHPASPLTCTRKEHHDHTSEGGDLCFRKVDICC